MKLTIVDITPAMAARWLNAGGPNRKKSAPHIRRLAHKMADGRWITNGQTISFDIDGKLIDGQHRLEAIVLSGVTIEHAVALDVSDPKAFTTYDGDALKRGAHQVATMMGASHGKDLVAASRIVYAYENSPTMEDFSQAVGKTAQFSNEHIAEYAVSIQDEFLAAEDMVGVLARKSGCRSLVLGLVIIFNRIDPVATSEFCRKLTTGVFTSEGDACLLLRDRLISSHKLKGIKWKRTLAAVTIKAFNYHCEGKPLNMLRWRTEGANPEHFPTIVGGSKK